MLMCIHSREHHCAHYFQVRTDEDMQRMLLALAACKHAVLRETMRLWLSDSKCVCGVRAVYM
jgi:hypothetical protein